MLRQTQSVQTGWHTCLIFFCPRKFLISTKVPALLVVMLIGK